MIPHISGKTEKIEEKFDFILLDSSDYNGKNFENKIQEMSSFSKSPPVVFFSMYIESKRLPENPIFSIQKPIKPRKLFEILMKAVFGITDDEASSPKNNLGEKLPLKILIAEDNTANQNIVLLSLQKLGYISHAVGNGHEVLECLRHQYYDVVLMDIQMPEMDGWETTEKIHKEFLPEQRPRIIAVTACDTDQDRQKCFQAGMDDYIKKPIRFGDLIEALEKCKSHRAQMLSNTKDSYKKKNIEKKMIEKDRQADENIIDMEAYDHLNFLLGKKAKTKIPELIEKFLKETVISISHLQDAYEAKDSKKFYVAAHGIKSTSASFGATSLSKFAKQLEQKAKKEFSDIQKESLQEIKDLFSQANEALRIVLKQYQYEEK